LNRDGSVKSEHRFPEDGSPLDAAVDASTNSFGSDLDVVGDLDGNGTVDLFVGGPDDRAFTVLLEAPEQVHCPVTPATGCLGAARGSLIVGDRAGDNRDFIKWKWDKGAYFAQGDLGDPNTDTSYALCIYDTIASAPAVAAEMLITPNDGWEVVAPKGLLFGETAGRVAGLRQIIVRTGDPGRSSIRARASGPYMPLPTPFSGTQLFAADPAVTVQLVNADGTCWESVLSTMTVNTAVRAKAVTP
jgi:hypothetical protein